MVFMYALLFIIFLLIVYELVYHRKLRAYARQLPGPTAFPFIGSAWIFLGSSIDFFKTIDKLIKTYGSRFNAINGPKLYFILADPKDAKAFTSSTKLLDKSNEYSFLVPWLGEGTLIHAGEKWKRHRKFIAPAFHFDVLKQFMPIIEENVDKLIQNLSKVKEREPFDIFLPCTLCALDIISESTMGVSINAQTNNESKYVKAVHGMCRLLHHRMRHIFLRFDIFFNISFSKLQQNKYVKTLLEFTDDVIERKKNALARNQASGEEEATETGKKKRVAFLDHLLTSDMDGKKLSDKSVRDEVNTFMFAGHDTTATSLAFTIYLISQHKEVQDKLFSEQQSIFGDDMDRVIEYNDLQEMNYLELVIKESLRLYPPVPLIGRSTKEEYIFNELTVPPGTNILLSLYHLHRCPDVFKDPDSFKPERFSNIEDNSTKYEFGYIPFSSGPRNCIGQRFSQIEQKMMISKLIRKFEFLPVDKAPAITFDIVLQSMNGINVALCKRQHSV